VGAALGHRGGQGAARDAPQCLDAAQISGINVLILWGNVIERDFSGQSWLTFRQTLRLGGHVRKGEHGTTVVYANRFTPEDERRRATDRACAEKARNAPVRSAISASMSRLTR